VELTNNILVLRLALKSKKDKSTDVDESIVARINEIAEKAGERPDVIMAEYKKRFAEYMKRDGITASKASIVTIKSIVGSYNAALRSNMTPIKGFFFGYTRPRNVTEKAYKEAEEQVVIHQKMFGDEWKENAITDGLIDVDGNLLYTKKNTTTFQSFLIGKKVPKVQMGNRAFGFFEMPNSGEVKPGNVFIKDPVNFVPEFGKVYMFKGTCKDENKDIVNISTGINTSKLVELDEEFDYDEFVTLVEDSLGDNCAAFEDVYDVANQVVNGEYKEQKFLLAEVIISKISIFDTYAYVEVTPLDDGFEGNVTLSCELNTVAGLCEQAVGIVCFKPWFNKKGEASGNLFGFVTDPKFSRPEDSYEIAENVETIDAPVEDDDFL
jgi:hypothetical protein